MISSLNIKQIPSSLTKNAKKENGKCNPYACQAAEKGGIQESKTERWITSTAELEVYRLYTVATSPETQGMAKKYGSWWSLTNPKGKKTAYMSDNAICPEFNILNRLVVCKLNPKVELFVGPTQSIKCKDGKVLKANSNLQVYIASGYGLTDTAGPKQATGKSAPFASCKDVASPLS